MIPHKIHYCWFGGNPLPEMAERCIASWQTYLPDYEIIRWDETNFDVHANAYIREAYALKKYAFVSDYARFWILQQQGGIYFDTDVEVISSIDDIIAAGPFLGREKSAPNQTGKAQVNTGLGMGCEAGDPLCGDMVRDYANSHFITPTGRIATMTVVQRLTQLLGDTFQSLSDDVPVKSHGYTIYPAEYFCPLNYFTGELLSGDNTRTIHHYAATWVHRPANVCSRALKRLTNIATRVQCSLPAASKRSARQ